MFRAFWQWVVDHVGSVLILMGAAMLVFWLTCRPASGAEVPEQGYPRLFSYHGGRSFGPPFTKDDGTLDSALIRLAARWPVITLNPNAVSARPDLVQCFRFFNPGITILYYHQFSSWHLDSTLIVGKNDQGMYAEWQRALQWSHGFVKTADKQYAVDWSQADVADTLTKVLVKYTRYGLADGWFFDYFEPAFSWTGIGTIDDDYNRLSHAEQLVDALHAVNPAVVVMGNGETADRVKNLDGRMKEGFTTSITRFDEALTLTHGDVLKSESPIGSSGNASLAAFTVATSCMIGAMAEHGNSHYTGAPEQATWWFPEYAVRPDGMPDPTGRYIGWLGQPTGAPSRTQAATWLRYFENGMALARGQGGGSENVQLRGTYRRIGSSVNITSIVIGPDTGILLVKSSSIRRR